MKTILLSLILVSVIACTKKEEKPKIVLELIEKYKKAQEEMPKFDERLKKAGTDEGEQIKINYEKELAKSRMERIKDQLQTLSPESVQEASAAAAGGHGGGH